MGPSRPGAFERKHQLLWQRPDLKIVDLRGNVPTRLQKLANEKWDAIILARAGLERLGFDLTSKAISFEGGDFFAESLPSEIFLSAGGQGVIAIQACSGENDSKLLLWWKKSTISETGLSPSSSNASFCVC